VTVRSAGWIVIVGAVGVAAPEAIFIETLVCDATVPVLMFQDSDAFPAAIVCTSVCAAPLFQPYVTSTGALDAGMVNVAASRR
jgi:hypothetical protein